MPRKFSTSEKSYERLKALVGGDTIVRIDRKDIDPNSLDGFVVGLTGSLLLLHLQNGNSLQLNGYSAVRLCDITGWRVDSSFIPRAMRLLDRKPIVPQGVPLEDWDSLIVWAEERYPLIMIEAEAKYPRCLFIGRVAERNKRGISLSEVDTKGLWRKKPRKYAFMSITQVEFGDGYTMALAALEEHERKRDAE